MASLADKWHSAILKNSLDLMRYDAHQRTEIIAMINELGRDLVADLSGAGLNTPRTDWQRARLRELLKSAQDRIGGTYEDIATTHATGLAGAAEASAAGLTLALNDAVGFELLQAIKWTPEQLAALVDGSMIVGAPSSAWWARQSVDLQNAFADQMQQGMLRGETVTQLRDRIMGMDLPGVNAVGKVDLRTIAPEDRGLIQIARRNAEALVRTSAMSVNNSAHMALYQANSDVIAELQWVSTLDLRVCFECSKHDSETWPLNTPHAQPPLHWNCFVGETLVESPDVLRGFERAYTGNVAIIRTASGNEVTCTPNHPILTDAGWVAAGQIKKGQKVVQRLPGYGFIGSTPNAVEVETRIEDVVTSLLGPRGMFPVVMPLSAEDFHGDAINHEVATVWSNGELGDEYQPSPFEHLCESCLKKRSARGLMGLTGLGREAHSLNGGTLPPDGVMRPAGEGTAFLGSHAAVTDQHGLGTAPNWFAVFCDNADDHVSSDAQLIRHCLDAIAALISGNDGEFVNQDAVGMTDVDPGLYESRSQRFLILPDFIREMVNRFPCFIAFDEVIEIRNRPGFVGHVYNLETEGNWYVASNIITHNCRCATVPITKTWEQLANKNKDLARELDNMPPGLRSSMGGPVSANTTWEDWFKGLKPEQQSEYLGPARQKLWEAGKLSLSDLTDQRGNALTLDELRSKL